MRRLRAIAALALTLLAIGGGLLPGEALAAEGDAVYVGGVELRGSVSGPVYATTDEDGNVTTSGAGEDSWNVRWDGGTLTLKDAYITGQVDDPTNPIFPAAIGVADSSGNAELTIQLEGSNTIRASKGVVVHASHGTAALVIEGGGSLKVSGSSNPGIIVQSNSGDASLTIQGADVTATSAYGDGVTVQASKGSDASLTVEGGGLTATGNGASGAGILFITNGAAAPGTSSLSVGGSASVDARGGGIQAGYGSSAQEVTPASGSTGIVFDGDEGTVYGDVTLQDDLEIGENESLTIPAGASLTIPEGTTLTNRGVVAAADDGALTNNGVIENRGTLPSNIGGSGTVSHIPTYTFNYPETLTLTEDHGSGFYAATGALSLGDDPVLTGGGRVVVYGTNKADFNSLSLSKADDPTKTVPVAISAYPQGSAYGVYLENPEETRVFAVLGADEAADFDVLCEIANMNKAPSGSYSGTISLYVGYTTDGSVKAGDAANDVDLSQLARYEVTVNLSVGHVHSPDAAWSSDADGHWHACSGCDDKLDYEVHTPKTVNAKAATCTEDGYTGDTVCSVCGYEMSQGESVPATGHAWGVWAVSEPATCTESGMEKRSCATCDATEERALPALGHELARVAAVDPTCTEPGVAEHWTCSRCGALFRDEGGADAVADADLVVPATGHSFTSYVSNGDAACTADGTETASCDNGCGAEDTRVEEGSALGHDWGVPAWAWSEDGAKFVATFTCARDAAHTRELTAEPAASVKVEPTCTEAGVRVYSATVELDGVAYTATSEQAIPALGHDFADGVCTRCGEKDPDYAAPAEPDEPQGSESERSGLPKTGDASVPAVIAAGVGSLLCLVAVPRLRRR